MAALGGVLSAPPSNMRRRTLLALTLAALALPAAHRAQAAGGAAPVAVARHAEAVVLTGADLPTWSRLPATGAPATYPSGSAEGERNAHNGTVVVPPDPRGAGVDVGQVVAYRWTGSRFIEIPVQVDERFPWFLANGNSDFGVYSGTDTELTYAWDVEAWNRTEGQCRAEAPAGTAPTPDPVAGLDDDDEIVVMASDAGEQAPSGELGPLGTEAGTRQEVAVLDPLNHRVT